MESMNHQNNYGRLLGMVLISGLAMYGLMYAMVNSLSNIYSSYDQFYMAGLMTMPMIVLEIILMRRMYSSRKANIAIVVLSVAAFLFFWIGIRQQTGIGDKQFLRAMIPHHGGAILMCEQASLQDPEVKTLCQNIIKNQQAEISQMKKILNRLP